MFWFSDGSHRGIEAIRAAFEATWRALPGETYWLEDVEWIANSDVAAACIYRFNWTAPAGDRQISGSGRGTTVLKRADSRWRIVHEHLSLEPAAK